MILPGQLALFDGSGRAAHARASDPQTSWDAARSITPDDISETQEEIYGLFHTHGPMTDQELQVRARRSGIVRSRSGIRTRRKELAEKGYIVDTNTTRPTRSGRQATVWGLA